MSEAKEALIRGIEESVRALDAVLGPEELPGPYDVEGIKATMSDGDFMAKLQLRQVVDILLARANQLRTGVWPLFRPEDGRRGMEMLREIREHAEAITPNEVFRQRIANALTPIRLAIERYASNASGEWLFPEEDCDPIPPWNPPPAGR